MNPRFLTIVTFLILFMVLVFDAEGQRHRKKAKPKKPVHAVVQKAIPNKPWGDQGNGNYMNPVIPGDYSDLDAIRVGNDFYAISSTFQFSPGMMVLHSKDLVNWRMLSHVADNLLQIGPAYNWDRMDRYGKGIQGGAIRYHDGKFWVYFCTPGEGIFMTSATDPAGPWQPLHKVWGVDGWDDCCPFWDNDDQGWLVATHVTDQYKVHLFKLSADGKRLDLKSDSVIHRSKGSQGNKLYKFYGMYYHLFSELKPEGRVMMMGRASDIHGPYELKQLNHVNKVQDRELNQGGLLQVRPGGWWFLAHQGSGEWDGRTACLLPVSWIEGWPIIGQVGGDTIGSMIWTSKKPIKSASIFFIKTDDEFNLPSLSVQWEWNHQPRNEKWSLTDRPGFLRLRAFPPVKAIDPKDKRSLFLRAGNTITQRSMRTAHSEASVRMELEQLQDGQTAGLCHFSATYSALAIRQSKGVRTLIIDINGQETTGPRISSKTIWLKSTWGLNGVSQYAYSLDGKTYTPIGDPYTLSWGNQCGDRIGLFTYNPIGENGAVDIDWFHYQY